MMEDVLPLLLVTFHAVSNPCTGQCHISALCLYAGTKRSNHEQCGPKLIRRKIEFHCLPHHRGAGY